LDPHRAPRGNEVSSDCGAKACIFSACVCKLKKLANTEVARKVQEQKLLLLFNAPFDSLNFPQNGKQNSLLPLPAARGGKTAREEELNFLRLLLQPRTAHLDFVELRALGVWFCAISLSLNKEMAKENQPRGKPLGTPRRVFVGATLSLRATRREDVKFQRLRARLQKSHAHFRANTFAFYICHAC